MAACGGPAFQPGEALSTAPPPSLSESGTSSTDAQASTTASLSDSGAIGESGSTATEAGYLDSPRESPDGTARDSAPDGETCTPGAGCYVPDCPPAGCLCESADGPCGTSLPFSCSAGAQCCNWRPPGC